MKRVIRTAGTYLFITAFAGCAVAMVFFRPETLRILTRLSPDKNVASPAIVFAGILTYLLAGLLFWRAATKPGLPPLTPPAAITLTAVLTACLVFHLQAVFPGLASLTAEDGLFESLTAIFAFAAAVLFAAGIGKAQGRLPRPARLGLALAFLFFGLEEISWGQRILGWETPAALSALNYQGETNFHNLINPMIPAAYAVLNAALAALMFSAGRLRRAVARVPGRADLARLLPGPEAALYGCVFLALLYHGTFVSSELTEVVIAMIGLSLALRQSIS